MPSSVGTVLLGLAILTSAATIPPMDNINFSEDSIPILNASTLGAIDPRFTMTHQYSGPALDESQCLMNIVFGLSELSMLNFTASIEPIVCAHPRYPGVIIVADTLAPESTIETRFLVWGLYAGATLMMSQNVFQTVEFMLQWDGVAVGRITLIKPPRPSTLGGSIEASSTIPITIGTSTNDSYTTNTPDNPQIHHLAIEFNGFRSSLPKYAVYVTVMKALIYIAEKNDRDELQPFTTIGPRPYDAILRLTQYTPRQPRAELFSYGWASRALPRIPQAFLQHDSWCEASFEVAVDDLSIGKGALIKDPR